jgi:hypothetical protein
MQDSCKSISSIGVEMRVAIIGSRVPTDWQYETARFLAEKLSELGHTIHTGAADGIDSAAIEGTGGKLSLFLPWESYNSNIINVLPETVVRIIVYDPTVHISWRDSVAKYHPHSEALTKGSFALMARNYGIVENCGLVLAFPKVANQGGTGQGIRIAKGLGIKCPQFTAVCTMSKEQILAGIVKFIAEAPISKEPSEYIRKEETKELQEWTPE